MANAQATRTWVSGVGDDANPCSRTAPCKTFAGAISKTAPGGEIDCLDEGGFGQVTITKAITIDCDSGPGGILAGAGNGININAGAGDTVNLRSININGISGATDGVKINSAKTVHILDMNIYNCSGAGINAAATGGANIFLTVKDTQIHECGSGVQMNATGGGLVAADIDHVAIYNTSTGINAQTASHFTLHNSTLFIDTIGVNQNGAAGGALGTIVGNTFANCATALQSIVGASMGASGNTFSGSSPVYNANGGSISSAGDNVNFQNGALGTANGPAVTKI